MNESDIVLENIRTRRSVRAYKPDPVPKEVIQKIAEAGTWAASGMGRQDPVIIAVTDKDLRDRLSMMNRRIMGIDKDPFYGAPAVLVVVADRSAPTYVYDGSLAIGNMMLAAHSLGVSSCWIHRAKEEFESEEGKEILESLGIKGNYEGIGHLILGYAADPEPEGAPRNGGRIVWA